MKFGGMLQVQSSPVQERMEYATQQQSVHPAFIGINPSFQDSLTSGFQDCADEAIRYLIEEEHFSPDDPIVVGLIEHLREQQKVLYLQQMVHYFSMTANSFENLDDSGISLRSDSTHTDSESDAQSIHCDESGKHEELSNNNVDMTTVTNIAEEILSLLHDGEPISDFLDDSIIVEQ